MPPLYVSKGTRRGPCAPRAPARLGCVLLTPWRGGLALPPHLGHAGAHAQSGTGQTGAVKLKVWLPFSSEPRKVNGAHEQAWARVPARPNSVGRRREAGPALAGAQPLSVLVRPDATVEEVLGYVLYEYTVMERQPAVADSLGRYSLWIVEDNGDIDNDFPGAFPGRSWERDGFRGSNTLTRAGHTDSRAAGVALSALERSRPIGGFMFDQFAISEDKRSVGT